MRGSPFLRALGALLVLLLMGVPVWHLTRPGVVGEGHEAVAGQGGGMEIQAGQPDKKPQEGGEAQGQATPARKLLLVFAYTTQPTALEVTYLGRAIWSGIPVAGREYPVDVPVPTPPGGAQAGAQGVELGFRVQWPADTLCALRVHASDEAGRESEKSVWGSGQVEEILTFP